MAEFPGGGGGGRGGLARLRAPGRPSYEREVSAQERIILT